MCTTVGKGSCGKEVVTYSITCNNCAERDIVRVYHGETSKNAYTCVKKHLEDLDRKINASVMWRQCRLDHNSELQDFTVTVTRLYQNDCMLRQIVEGVSQDNALEGALINTKKEWNCIHLPRGFIDDGERDQYGSNSS